MSFISNLIFAICIIIFAERTLVPIVLWLQKIEFLRQRQEEYSKSKFGFLEYNEPQSLFESYYSKSGKLPRELHKLAVTSQIHYQKIVTAMAILVTIALFSLAISTDFREPIWFKELLVWIEIVALVRLFFLFRKSQKANLNWVLVRTKAEHARLLRTLSALVFDDRLDDKTINKSISEGLESHFDIMEKQVNQSSIPLASIETAEIAITRFREIPRCPILVEDVRSYLNIRISKQLKWFSASSQRISREIWLDSKIALTLFVLTVFLAAIKLVTFYLHLNITSEYLNFSISLSLLLCAGASAAFAYYFKSKGNAALFHSYESQQRKVHNLMKEQSKPFMDFIKGNRKEQLTGPTLKEFIDLVCNFEKLQMDEHLQWIIIKEKASIELGS